MHAFLLKIAENNAYFRLIPLYLGCSFLGYYLISSLGGTLVPFFIAILLAYLLNSPLSLLASKGIPRGLGALFIILIVVCFLVLITVVALPYIQRELMIHASTLPDLAHQIMHRISPLLDRFSGHLTPTEIAQIKTQISSYFGDFIRWSIQFFIHIITSGLLLANVLSLVILTPIITFYLLRDWPHMIHFLKPWCQHSRWYAIFERIDEALMAYLSGQAMVSLCLMGIYSLTLYFLGLKHGFLLGLFIGVLSFIPFIGFAIGLFLCLFVALTQYTEWTSICVIIGAVFGILFFEGNYLTPRFIGHRVGLHPVMVLFSVFAAAQWWGVIGVMFALPIAACLIAVLRALTQNPARLLPGESI